MTELKKELDQVEAWQALFEEVHMPEAKLRQTLASGKESRQTL